MPEVTSKEMTEIVPKLGPLCGPWPSRHRHSEQSAIYSIYKGLCSSADALSLEGANAEEWRKLGASHGTWCLRE